MTMLIKLLIVFDKEYISNLYLVFNKEYIQSLPSLRQRLVKFLILYDNKYPTVIHKATLTQTLIRFFFTHSDVIQTFVKLLKMGYSVRVPFS